MLNNKNYDAVFPTRLRKLIEESNINQQEIADFVGVSRQAISQWKDGKTIPDMYNFQKICQFFKVPYEYLYGESISQKQENMECANKLGLSDKAIEILEHTTSVNFCPYADVISDIICDKDNFMDIVNAILSGAEAYARTRDIEEIPPEYRHFIDIDLEKYHYNMAVEAFKRILKNFQNNYSA